MAIAMLDLSGPHVWLFRNENPINVFIVDSRVFGSRFFFFCSTKKIFESAWKSCFNSKSFDNDVKEAHYLKNNQLFRISTEYVKVNKTTLKRLLWYPIAVKKPFHKGNQYYGSHYGGAWNSASSKSITKPKQLFWSKVVNPSLPQLGCRFEKESMGGLRSALSGKDSVDDIQVDGMTVDEFTVLNLAWRTLRQIGRKKVKIQANG